MNFWIFQLLSHPLHKVHEFLFLPAQHLSQRLEGECFDAVEKLLKVVHPDLLHNRVLGPEPPRQFNDMVLDIDEPDLFEPAFQFGAWRVLIFKCVSHLPLPTTQNKRTVYLYTAGIVRHHGDSGKLHDLAVLPQRVIV